jgi:single-strand DNA-binding protein
MTMINSLTIVGRVTRDPEIKHLESGKAVTKFSVAVDQRAKKKGDNDKTDFFDVELWDKAAEFASQYVGKGQMVAVTGRHESRKVEGTGTYWTLKADTLDPFVGGKSESKQNGGGDDFGF